MRLKILTLKICMCSLFPFSDEDLTRNCRSAIERAFNSELPIYHLSSFGLDKQPCLLSQDCSQEELRFNFYKDRSLTHEINLRRRAGVIVKQVSAAPREFLKNTRTFLESLQLDALNASANSRVPQNNPLQSSNPMHAAQKPIEPIAETDLSIWRTTEFQFGHIPEDEPPISVR
jgi:hypothetical protein